MATLKHDCPHCQVKDLALRIHVAVQAKTRGGILLMTCPRCDMPIGAFVLGGASVSGITMSNGDPTLEGWDLIKIWPEPTAPEIPELLPADIERAYLQAERNFAIPGNEEAAGIMYGKALDIAVKKIDPALKGMLGPKLDALLKQGKLTRELGEWAHEVRALRNEAAHEEVPIEREDLEDLRHFTDMMLRYLFTLPAMTAERRKKAVP